MKPPRHQLMTIVIYCLISHASSAQEQVSISEATPSGFLFGKISSKLSDVQRGLNKQTAKYLRRLQKAEHKLIAKIAEKDTSVAASIEKSSGDFYQSASLSPDSAAINSNADISYSKQLDTLRTALLFLQARGKSLQNRATASVDNLKSKVDKLQSAFNQSEDIKKFLDSRKAMLGQALQRVGLGDEISKYSKELYYYKTLVSNYKSMIDNPSRLERKALEFVTKLPAFQEFFKKYSMISSLFRMPGSMDGNTDPLIGLQTRSLIEQDLQQRLGVNSQSLGLFQQNVRDGRNQLSQLKDKMNDLVPAGKGDATMPDFRPNDQKTKSFWKRIELGTNLQTVKSNNLFPVTTDIAVTAGFKINQSNVIGFGAAMKVGWGTSWQHIAVTAEGLNLRNFWDWKIKGNLWFTAGAEMNYYHRIYSFSSLKQSEHWQKAAVAGIQKKYKLKKLSGKIQLLYDFLYRQHIPNSQPLLFRTGYTF